MRQIPKQYTAKDWPRLVALSLNALTRNTVTRNDFANLGDFADDTTAAANGIAIGELYRTGSAIKVRAT